MGNSKLISDNDYVLEVESILYNQLNNELKSYSEVLDLLNKALSLDPTNKRALIYKNLINTINSKNISHNNSITTNTKEMHGKDAKTYDGKCHVQDITIERY